MLTLTDVVLPNALRPVYHRRQGALERAAGGVTDAMAEMRRYAHANPDFAEIAGSMEAQWLSGLLDIGASAA